MQPPKQATYSALLSPNTVNHLEAAGGAGCSALAVSSHSICENKQTLFHFFSPHCSCFAASCHSSHQKNRFGCCWARVFFQLSKKLICNSESCPDSGGFFFFSDSRLVLSFLQWTLNWDSFHASNSNWMLYSLSCLQYIITVCVCVSAGMVPMQQQQQQQQQGFPMVPVMQPNMQGMMGMNYGGQMPPGAMPMQVRLCICNGYTVFIYHCDSLFVHLFVFLGEIVLFFPHL